MTLREYLTFFAGLAAMRPDLVHRPVWMWTRRIGMTGQASRTIREVAIGQRQGTEIARAFLTDADIVLPDEPFIALDITITERLHRFFRAGVRGERLLVITLHNLETAWKFVDEFLLIDRGRIIERVSLTSEHDIFVRVRPENTAETAGIIDDVDVAEAFRTGGDTVGYGVAGASRRGSSGLL